MAHWNKAARARTGDPLTPRELEILALLAAGHSTPDIAEQLGITPGTLKTHLTSVYKKIGAQNRVQIARRYLDHHADRRARGRVVARQARQRQRREAWR